jgi:uncharacterized protein YqeY
MSIKQRVEAAIADAMKKRDQERLSALRMIKAEFLLKEKETGKSFDDAAADGALLGMLKKYKKAKEEYESLDKHEEARRYERDMKVIESFMSAPMMDEDGIRHALEALVTELHAAGPKDFGRVMKEFMAAHSNADGKAVSSLLKGILDKK